jgi:hypothetical protein
MTNNQDYDQLSVTIEKLLDKLLGHKLFGISLWRCVWRKEFFAVVEGK